MTFFNRGLTELEKELRREIKYLQRQRDADYEYHVKLWSRVTALEKHLKLTWKAPSDKGGYVDSDKKN